MKQLSLRHGFSAYASPLFHSNDIDMKKNLLTGLALLSLWAGIAQTKSSLYNGKPIPVRLTAAVESKNRFSITPTAIVDADILDNENNRILIRRGTPVIMDVQTQRAKGVGKPGYVKIDCLTTTAVDGQLIRLTGSHALEGKSRKGTALGVGLGVGIPFFWPCMFCLCIKGENVAVPANTVFNNIVVNDRYLIEGEVQ